MRLRETSALWAASIVAIAIAAGCSTKKTDDGTAPITAERALPAITVRDDTPDLMLTWIDDKGDTHVELHPPDVPASARERVRVVASDREEGTHDLFYVADLTKKTADGAYATQTVRRRDWEAEIEKRRDAYLAKIAPPPRPVGSAEAGNKAPAGVAEKPPSGAVTVIIYGASWCKPCHQAADYAKSKGASVVMKDIEESPAAAAEMREKLERSGQRGGSIPVIDVRGQIIVGFSPGAVDRALAKAASGTVL